MSEDREGEGMGVEEVVTAGRAELAVGEEAGQWRVFEGIGHESGIGMGVVEQALAAGGAGHEHGPRRRPAKLLQLQQQAQVIFRRPPVA